MADEFPQVSYRLTDHARLEMERRQISEQEIARILATPEQILNVRLGRVVYQARTESSEPPKTYLIRVFLDVDRNPPEVVTVYRTSKLEKYWSDEK
ncbi:MAG: DUF4258 domain-containing protein [Chloroflexota bacterium]